MNSPLVLQANGRQNGRRIYILLEITQGFSPGNPSIIFIHCSPTKRIPFKSRAVFCGTITLFFVKLGTYAFFLCMCLPISGLGLEYPLVSWVGIKSFALGPTPYLAASFRIPRRVWTRFSHWAKASASSRFPWTTVGGWNDEMKDTSQMTDTGSYNWRNHKKWSITSL